MNVRDLQSWLVTRGATGLVIDGRGGPATRAAFLAAFANRSAPAITDAELVAMAARLGDPSGIRLRAVAAVEAAGSGFLDSGHPKLLYERHWFYRRTDGRFGTNDISNPSRGGYTLDADRDGINDSWEKLAQAVCLSPLPACESVSIGKFQVMGGHAVKLGYPSALEMLWDASRSEAAHYEMAVRYIERFDLKLAFQRLSARPDDCRAFARGYNGPSYADNDYHRKLAAKIAQLTQP